MYHAFIRPRITTGFLYLSRGITTAGIFNSTFGLKCRSLCQKFVTGGCLNYATLCRSISSNRSSLKSRGCVQSFKRPLGLHPPPIAQVDTRQRLSYLREHRRHRPKTTNNCSLVENVRATLHNVLALAAMICGPLGNRSKHRCLSQQPGFAGSSLRAMRCSCTYFCSPAAVPCRHFEAAQTIAVHCQQRRRCLLLLPPEPSSCHPVQNRSKNKNSSQFGLQCSRS